MPFEVIDGFEVNANKPIDGRTVKANASERDAIPDIQRYEGLTCFVAGENKEYWLVGGITNDCWKEKSGKPEAEKSASELATGDVVVVIDEQGQAHSLKARELFDFIGGLPVNVDNLADGKVLQYNAANQRFELRTLSGGSGGPLTLPTHNQLDGLQGGAPNEHFHLSASDFDKLQKLINPFHPATVSLSASNRLNLKGLSVSPTLSGSVRANDEKNISKLIVRELNTGVVLQETENLSYSFDAPATLDNRRYQTEIHTGESGIVKSGIVDVEFAYPFFWGMHENPSLSAEALYQAFAPKVEKKGSKSATYNGAGMYVYFAYPASYGLLKRIKDPNGFSALGSFVSEQRNVKSVGLDQNWDIAYRVYVSANQTAVSNGTFRMEF